MKIVKIHVVLFVLQNWKCKSEPSFSLIADVNAVGVSGTILFTQENKYYPVSIRTNLQPTQKSLTLGWQIHAMPVLWDYTQDDYCRTSVRNSAMLHNLTARHGLINSRALYNDETISVLSFKESIAGSSLIITNPTDDSIVSCSTILPVSEKQSILVADFFKNLGGQIYFISYFKVVYKKSLIIGYLHENNGSNQAKVYDWFIGSKTFDYADQECFDLASQDQPFNPFNIVKNQSCNYRNGDSCIIGNISSKVGRLFPGVSSNWLSVNPFTYKDPILPLDGVNSIESHALYVVEAGTKNLVSCAIIRPAHENKFKVVLKRSNDLELNAPGLVYFRQLTPYHSTYVKIRVKDSQLLTNRANEPPTFAFFDRFPLGDDCSNIGTILYDRQISPRPLLTVGMFSDYKVDSIHNNTIDISFVTSFTLFTKNTILGLSLAVLKSLKTTDSEILLCGQILPNEVEDSTTFIANFSNHPLIAGYIVMTQYLYNLKKQQFSDTVVIINIRSDQDSTKSFDHKFHVHTNPVAIGDIECTSTGPHYNPFSVDISQPMYDVQCNSEFPRRCEVGDLNNKYRLLNVPTFQAQYVDTNLNLYGAFSILGRSLVLHKEGKQKAALGCANIEYLTKL